MSVFEVVDFKEFMTMAKEKIAAGAEVKEWSNKTESEKAEEHLQMLLMIEQIEEMKVSKANAGLKEEPEVKAGLKDEPAVTWKVADAYTHTNRCDLVSGGYPLETSYMELFFTFGEPTLGPDGGGKPTCEWIVEFSDGTVARIYDFDCDDTGVTDRNRIFWHIDNAAAASHVYKIYGDIDANEKKEF